MSKYYYQKRSITPRGLLKILSLGIVLLGASVLIYVFFPLLSWQVYFAPVFANQNIATPIPKLHIVNNNTMSSLLSQASDSFLGVNYEDPQTWFPTYNPNASSLEKPKISFYTLSIPALNIENAVVSTVDNNLKEHLINYQGTAVPPEKGNAVIFGHSTLPQLYNPKDYKTIFANAYKLKTGDEIFIKIGNITYKYNVSSIIVVDPKDTSVLEQNYNDSYLTLITCTPPGTVWKRLIIKSSLQKI